MHPGAGHPTGTLVNALIAHCGASLSGIGGVARPGIVHRLDKDTSGLLVVAKTDQAHRALAEQFADHGRTGELERGYLALVWGAPPRPHGTIDAPIGRHPTSRTKMAVVPGARRTRGRDPLPRGRRPSARQRSRSPRCSNARLETGRTHQVRVHLAQIGHPLIGDPVYGRASSPSCASFPSRCKTSLPILNRQALHAAALGFVHPVTGTLLEFNSPLPDDFAEIVDAFKEL